MPGYSGIELDQKNDPGYTGILGIHIAQVTPRCCGVSSTPATLNQLLVGDRLEGHGLLHETKEELAAVPGPTAVEAERELVEVTADAIREATEHGNHVTPETLRAESIGPCSCRLEPSWVLWSASPASWSASSDCSADAP